MNFRLSDNCDIGYLRERMMGPNAMRIAEEMASSLPLAPGMRVLDLGCGMGLSSVLLALKHDVTVFACDLWIPPEENAKHFAALGLDDAIIPLHVDAEKKLPFASEYFDALFSVDAYHYFGCKDGMLASLLACVKPGGLAAAAVPGLQREFADGAVPEELLPFWQEEMRSLHSCAWWEELWRKTPGIDVLCCREMDCFRQAWDEWLSSPNPYAAQDIPMMRAEGGKHFNLVQIVCRKR